MKTLIAQKCVLKAILAFIISFLWAKYIRLSPLMTISEYPLIFFGAFYLMLAWFNYLKLDGLKINTFANTQKKVKKSKHKTKQMIDYVDTELQPDVELTPKQILQAKLISNVICGVVFIIPSFYLFFTR